MIKAGFVDGAFVEGKGDTLSVEDPSTGKEFTSLPGMSADQVRDAIASSRKAYDSGVWSDLSMAERADKLRPFVKALEARSEWLVDIIMQEAGCPRVTHSMHMQVAHPMTQASQIIDFALTLPDHEENPLPLSERINAFGQTYQSLRRYTPIGVVSAIAAYNFPFLTALWKVIPALITGNTVVLRPSPFTPLSTAVFGEAAAEANLPPGVLNYVVEPGVEGGQIMSTDPMVDMVAFTGSSRVGALVMEQAAATMKRLQLELGGKSAQIFLPDAVDRVVPVIAGSITAHAGQGCAIGTRVFVPEETKAEVLEKCKAALEGVKIGPADAADTVLGPVISRPQVERCEHFVKAAVDAGGKIATGGKRPEGMDGFFFEPTVLDLPDNKNPAAQEEIFGPVIAVIGYRDLDHAVEMANDSVYGLSGYVHGNDKKTALDVGLRIKSGTVNVNGGGMSTYVSSGGQRMSGIARERGVEGIRLYQQMSVLNLG